MLLIDDETHSYWDHITGEAVHGPLKGAALPSFPVHHTTVGAQLQRDPQTPLFRPSSGLLGAAMKLLLRKGALHTKGVIPPFFRGTMGEADERLDELSNGLGVVVEGRARFYPLDRLGEPIEEDWSGRTLRVALGELDGAPQAVWTDDGSRPMQLLSRWYGFSFSFPGCGIYAAD